MPRYAGRRHPHNTSATSSHDRNDTAFHIPRGSTCHGGRSPNCPDNDADFRPWCRPLTPSPLISPYPFSRSRFMRNKKSNYTAPQNISKSGFKLWLMHYSTECCLTYIDGKNGNQCEGCSLGLTLLKPCDILTTSLSGDSSQDMPNFIVQSPKLLRQNIIQVWVISLISIVAECQ